MAGTELAKAYVQIIPSAKGISGGIQREINPEADVAGKSFGGKLVGVIKGVIATAAIGKALSSAISEGAALEQSLGGIETLFKDSADKVKANAAQAYKTAGMSANDYMELTTSFSASLLSSLSNDTSKAADIADMAMVDMSDNANKMGTNMEDIKNAYQGFAKQNYTMLDNLKLGYGGTKTEMERLLADAQKISGVEYNIDNLSDVYSAIHVIQGELDITGTTAKEAATTLSGSLGQMKAAFKNLLGNMALGESITQQLSELRETVIIFLRNLIPMIGNVLSALPTVVSQAVTLAVQCFNLAGNNAQEIVNQGIQLVAGLANAIITGLPYLAEAAINLIAAFGSALINADWIGIGQTFVVNLKSGLDLAAGEILGTDGSIVEYIKNAISTKLPEILEQGVEIVTNIVNGILQNIPQLLLMAGTLMSSFTESILLALPTILEAGAQLLLNLVNGIIQNAPQIASAAAQTVSKMLTTIGQHLPEVLQSGIEIIGRLAAGLIRAIPTVVGAIPQIVGGIKDAFFDTDWGSIGLNIIQGIANGLSGAASMLWDAVKGVLGNFKDQVLSFFGIHSPSRWGVYVGQMIDTGIANGLVGNLPMVNKASEMLEEMAMNPFSKSNMSYAVNSNLESESGASGKLDEVIAILKALLVNSDREISVTISEREFLRLLREKGVVFA